MKLALAGAGGDGADAITAGPGSFRATVLPWASAAADERRFRGILRGCLLAAVALAVALPWVHLTPVDRQLAQPLPAPITRLLLERKVPMAVPTAKPDEKGRNKAETQAEKPAEKPADAQLPPARPGAAAPRPAPPLPPFPPSARLPVEGRTPGEVALDQARRKAAGSGLLALKNEISALGAALPALALKPDAQAAPGAGTTNGAGTGAGGEAGEPARALVTASAGRSSGGVGNAAASRDGGGSGNGSSLAGRATTVLAGAGTAGPAAGGAGKPATTAAPRGSARAARSIEDIKLVFERQKGAIYALYNRALRDDPALQGKVVLELKIAPSGQVTDLRIVSSELKSEDLERKLLARIRLFDFGARDVDALVLTWPLDFLPS